jgi:serine protease Do
VETPSDLRLAITNIKPGNRAQLTVFRQGKTRELGVTVGELDAGEAPTARAVTPKPEGDSAASKSPVGLAVVELTDAQKRELRLKNGVRVEAVEGAGARAGLRPGDIIITVDNQEVNNVQQFNAALAKVDKNKAVAMLVRRNEASNFVLVRPSR